MFDPLKIQENDQDLTLLECSTSNRFIFKDMARKCQNLSSEGEEETGIKFSSLTAIWQFKVQT